jgi:hypothetical protein
MSLQADTINLDAPSLERLDEIQGGCGFGARVLDIVVVVIELHIWISGRSGLEGDGDVLWADGVIEDVRTVCPIIIEGFVYNIPSITFAFVMRDFINNMVLKSCNQGCICPRVGSDCWYT